MDINASLAVAKSYFTAPVQIGLLIFVVFIIRRLIISKRKVDDDGLYKEPELPSLGKRDFTLEELKPYNGVEKEHILVAVNGKVFDVSKGKSFYGPGIIQLDMLFHLFWGKKRHYFTKFYAFSFLQTFWDTLYTGNSLHYPAAANSNQVFAVSPLGIISKFLF